MSWRRVEQLGIHGRMKEVVQKTIEATRLQLEHERKKLRKLKYGS